MSVARSPTPEYFCRVLQHSSEAFLRLAESHVIQGELLVAQQLQRIRRMEARGCSGLAAQQILCVLEDVLAAMNADLKVARLRADERGSLASIAPDDWGSDLLRPRADEAFLRVNRRF